MTISELKSIRDRLENCNRTFLLLVNLTEPQANDERKLIQLEIDCNNLAIGLINDDIEIKRLNNESPIG